MEKTVREQAGLKEAVSLPREKMTYEEFLAWCDEDTWAEWVDGEVIVLSPASDRHQDLSDWLAWYTTKSRLASALHVMFRQSGMQKGTMSERRWMRREYITPRLYPASG